MAVTGTLIAESLKPDSGVVLDVPLVLRRMQRVTVGNASTGQPTEWTLVDFTCPDDEVDRFAEQLAKVLATGPWYADFANETHKFVVLAGRVHRYERGDAAGLEAAREDARKAGVPDSQLDWPI